MQPEKTRTIEQAHSLQIPQPLLDKLKTADEKLQKARADLETATAGTDPQHQERVNRFNKTLQEAEAEVEAANQEIARQFHQK